MVPALRRIRMIPFTAWEWGEVLTGAIALGWAQNFADPARFGPPGSTVAHVTNAVGPGVAAAWAILTAILPWLSIADGRRIVRLVSTVLCGFVWTALVFFSWRQGTYVTAAVGCGLVGLAALLWSQICILRFSPDER